MRINYRPVQKSIFVNTRSRSFAHVKVSTHNAPTVTVRIGKIGRSGIVTRQLLESREDAREHAESVISRLTTSGYEQVA